MNECGYEEVCKGNELGVTKIAKNESILQEKNKEVVKEEAG